MQRYEVAGVPTGFWYPPNVMLGNTEFFAKFRVIYADGSGPLATYDVDVAETCDVSPACGVDIVNECARRNRSRGLEEALVLFCPVQGSDWPACGQ